MANVFWPTGKRLRLAGIKTADGSIVSSPKLVQKELAEHWAPVYAAKPIDTNAANTLLGVYFRKHRVLIRNFRSCTLPTNDEFKQIISRVKDSACGPDGIPYSAYGAGIDISAAILENTTEYFCHRGGH